MVATGYTGGDPRKVDRAGDTMTGDLVLPGDPDQPLEAATKQYVDNTGGGGGVPASRTINAGVGLTGGGDLTVDRTISANTGTGAGQLAAGDDSRIVGAAQKSANLSDLTDDAAARTSLGLGDSATLNVGTTAGTVAAGDDSRFGDAVPASRLINSGTGLAGGGDLTADRTLSVVYGNTAGTSAQGNDARLSDARTPTAHASTHADGGSDEVTLTQSQITDLTPDLAAKVEASTLTTKGDLLVRNATVPDRQGVGADGTVLTANSATTTGVEWATPATVARNTETWSRDGDATVTTGAMRWYNRTGETRTIHGAWAAAGTAPVGAALIVDVNRDGTTIFTTQGNRPTIADGSNGGTLATPDVTTVADGSYLTVDIDQIGSGTAGADVTVGVVMS